MKIINWLLLLGVMASCVKERIIPPPEKGPIKLFVNELQSSGSVLLNESGVASDWIELYNDSEDTFRTNGLTFFISDSLGYLPKDTLPDFTINPKSHLIIYCDGEGYVGTQIHTNFKLSSAGEHVAISYVDAQNNTVIIDSRVFGAIPSGKSESRVPDGSNNWSITDPTPGNPN